MLDCWSLLSELLTGIIPTSTCQTIQIGLDLHIPLHHQLLGQRKNPLMKSQKPKNHNKKKLNKMLLIYAIKINMFW